MNRCPIQSIRSPGRCFRLFFLVALTVQSHLVFAANARDDLHYWPQWRGPLTTGLAPYADPPIEWSENKNIRWKSGIPGFGHSTPVVWGEYLYLTSAKAYGESSVPKRANAYMAHDNVATVQHQEFIVLAVRRANGQIAWQKTVHRELPAEGGHNTASLASNSPVTEGKRIYASFGSRGLFCLDLKGNILWTKDFGEMLTKHAHGEGSSPVLYENTIVVNWDHEGESFVIALDKRTGEQQWKSPRDEVTSWATPIVVNHNGRPQVIVSGTGRIRGYDLATGKTLWECGGLSANVVASPVSDKGIVFAGSSYEKQALLAIRLQDATGDITDSKQIVWFRRFGTPYVPSLLLVDGSLYYLRHYQGVLSRVDTRTGEDQGGPFRMKGIGDVYASPVSADGRIYITDREGTTLVLSHEITGDPQILAKNKLDDSFSASAALADREFYLRGEKHLYCISNN
jgi:hypothetical protein